MRDLVLHHGAKAVISTEEAGLDRMVLSLIGLLLVVLPEQAVRADSTVTPRLQLELEGGVVWKSRNNVQIPNDATGTRFSLVDLTGKGPWPAARLYATWNTSEKHGLRLLLAPLSVTETAVLGAPVEFAGGSFVAGVRAEATYKFNSWRLTYRYRFHAGEHWRWWIGLTAKIRDAKIRLKQGADAAVKTDVGFVPLLHIAGIWRVASDWAAELDIDALAGGPGRAEDATLKLKYRLGDRWSVTGGYRTVEGGADVDEVHNFAWLHYAVFSASLAF